jgi:hypothetical protein
MAGTEQKGVSETGAGGPRSRRLVFGRRVVAGLGVPTRIAILLVAAALLVLGTWQREVQLLSVIAVLAVAVLHLPFVVGKVVIDANGVTERRLRGNRRIAWSRVDHARPASDLSGTELNFYDAAGKLAGRINFGLYARAEKIVEEVSRRVRLEAEPAAIAPVTKGRWRDKDEVSAARMFSLMWQVLHGEPGERAAAIDKVYRLAKADRISSGAERERLLAICQEIEKGGMTDVRRRDLEDWYYRTFSRLLRAHLAGYYKGGMIGVTIGGVVGLVKFLVEPGRIGRLYAALMVLGMTAVFYGVAAACAAAYTRAKFRNELAFLKKHKTD